MSASYHFLTNLDTAPPFLYDGGRQPVSIFPVMEVMDMNALLKGIEHPGHASIRMKGERTVYVDPFQIRGEPQDADVIFITHSHHDHFSPEDIRKVKKADTLLVLPVNCVQLAAELGWHNALPATAGERGEAAGIPFEAVPAYNLEKHFHEQNRGWVGYLIPFGGVRYYIAGDTDFIPEMRDIRCDVAFLPVGGTYTMSWSEAAEAAAVIAPKVAIPTHYGAVIGDESDAEAFVRALPEGIEGIIL